ncbi:MAG: DUF4190 domain-containing protein [Actinomycetia bacterium]|nr:DUF4190 domain-containing protein [Actinomycetes bacterium]
MTDFSSPPGRPEDEPEFGLPVDPPGDVPIEEPPTWGKAPAPSPFGPGPGASPRQHRDDRPPTTWVPTEPNSGGASQPYPRQSIAVPAMVLSVMGIACCGLTAPIGLIMGYIDLRAIDEGRTDPEKRGTARAALIVGAVSTTLFVGMVAVWILLVVVAALSGSSS